MIGRKWGVQMISSPSCWICASKEKLTREHFPKRADSRNYFGRGRTYRHDSATRNEIIQGAGSDRLTLSALICEECNTQLTRPYDAAWDALRTFLLANWPSVLSVGEFNLRSVYRDDCHQSAIDLQLYFVKVLGCGIADQAISVPLQPFRDALLNRTAHPYVYLTFSHCEREQSVRRAGGMISACDIHVLTDRATGEAHMTYWRYAIEPLAIRICFVAPAFPERPVSAAWHPLSGTLIRLGAPLINVSIPPLR